MENPVDKLLDKIRLNSVYLTNKHINNHLYYKHSEKWFEIPTIILSVFAGSFSVGGVNGRVRKHAGVRLDRARAQTCRSAPGSGA